MLLSPAQALGQPGGGVHMGVDIDQAGGEIEAAHIEGLVGPVGGDVGIDGGDCAVGNGQIAGCVEIVFGVDQVTPLQQQIEHGTFLQIEKPS